MTLLQCFKLLVARGYGHAYLCPLHHGTTALFSLTEQIGCHQQLQDEIDRKRERGCKVTPLDNSYQVVDDKIIFERSELNNWDRSWSEGWATGLWRIQSTHLYAECRRPLR